MKKIFFGFLFTGLSLFVNLNSFGQAHLHIVRLDSFPQLPNDTAFEGVVYPNIRIAIANTGSSIFFGDIHVYLYSQSLGSSAYDTLRDGPHPNVWIFPGDTVSIHANPNYSFRTIHYAAGDNIIVVWPFSGGVNFDTLQTHVYYEMLVGIDELNPTTLIVSPNPVSQILHLNYVDENKVEQVRIYDLMGRELFSIHEAVKRIDVSAFNQGLYFLELIQKDGRRAAKKILFTGN